MFINNMVFNTGRVVGSFLIPVVSLLLFTNEAMGQTAPATDLLNREISIDVKEVKLIEVLEELEEKAQVKFEYSPDRLRLNEKVSITANRKKLGEVLTELLAPFAIRFTISEQYQTILLKPVQSKGNERAGNTTSNGYLQVTGTVTDAATNEPLPGVSVVIKGTANGVATGADGSYSIEANEDDVLVFTFISFKTTETKVGERSVIDVLLETEVSTLKEVVVNAGYYDVKDKEKTGSISKVTSDVIEKQPVTNVLSALQGRTPGMYVSQSSGVPGSNFQVRIRGTNSIQNGNNPLYVVDGVPFISESMSNASNTIGLYGSGGVSPLQSINPNDIESIEILRDADLTAIYGSRGANGVVLITTKKGKAGAMKVDVNVRFGASKMLRRVDLMNTKEYIAMRMEAVENDGVSTPATNEYDINETWNKNRYTDWQDVLLGGTAPMMDVNASISGGSVGTQFLFGVGYNSQGIVFPGSSSADRISNHFSITHTSLNKKFHATISNSYSISTSNIVSRDLTSIAFDIAPNAPKLYKNGELNWENNTWSENPMAILKKRYSQRATNLITNIEFGYDFTKALQFKTSVGLNEIRNIESDTNPSDVYPPYLNLTPASSFLRTASASSRSIIIEPQLNWHSNIGKGRLSALIGTTYQSRINEADGLTFKGFPSNSLIDDPKSAATSTLDSYSYSEYRYAAVYARLNYIWNDKYIINLTGRRDGSSRFGPGRKFATLGAIGAGWVFSNEQFIQNSLPFLSFGKLRSSIGITGNDQIGDYRFLDAYSARSQYQNITALVPTQLYNPDYGWEVNKKIEGAIELGFLNDRITTTIAYYNNRSSNQLIDYKLAGTTGYGTVLLNSPATVQNSGTEFDITSINLNTDRINWTTSFNITIPKNKLVSFPNLETSSYANQYIVGKPITIQKVYHYLGVDPTTGFYKVEDKNHDGNFNPDDYSRVLNLGQVYYGGINNSISFGRWQVDVFIQFVRQNGYKYISNETPGWQNKNQPTFVFNDRWREPGDEADRQRFSRSYDAYNAQSLYNQSDAVADVWSFARLKNVSVSYQLPDKLLRFVKSRVYVQAQNLFTITDYKGLDPETGSYSLPPLTTLIGGLQLTF